jgi:hypothetical protein
MSINSDRQIEQFLTIDEFASRIVCHLDEAVDEIPHHIEKRLAAIRARVLERKFGGRTINNS